PAAPPPVPTRRSSDLAKDPVTLRGYRVMAHTMGTPVASDRLVYEEKDDTFQMGIGRTTDDRFICVVVESTTSDEQRCSPAAAPRSEEHTSALQSRFDL